MNRSIGLLTSFLVHTITNNSMETSKKMKLIDLVDADDMIKDRKIEELKAQLEQVTKDFGVLMEDKNAWVRSADGYKAQVKDLKILMKKTETEKNMLKDENLKLKAEYAALNQKHNELEIKNLKFFEDYRNAKQQETADKPILAMVLANDLKTVKKDLDDAKSQQYKLAIDLDKEKNENKKLQTQYDHLFKAFKVKEGQLDILEIQLSNARAVAKTKCENYQSAIGSAVYMLKFLVWLCEKNTKVVSKLVDKTKFPRLALKWAEDLQDSTLAIEPETARALEDAEIAIRQYLLDYKKRTQSNE